MQPHKTVIIRGKKALTAGAPFPGPFRQRAGLRSLPRTGVNRTAPPRGYVHPEIFYWR